MRTMTLGLIAAALALTTHTAFAEQPERKELQVFNDISKTVNRYAFFTIFDDVNANVENGVVTLTGKVTMPFKSEDIAKRVEKGKGKKLPGVVHHDGLTTYTASVSLADVGRNEHGTIVIAAWATPRSAITSATQSASAGMA